MNLRHSTRPVRWVHGIYNTLNPHVSHVSFHLPSPTLDRGLVYVPFELFLPKPSLSTVPSAHLIRPLTPLPREFVEASEEEAASTSSALARRRKRTGTEDVGSSSEVGVPVMVWVAEPVDGEVVRWARDEIDGMMEGLRLREDGCEKDGCGGMVDLVARRTRRGRRSFER